MLVWYDAKNNITYDEDAIDAIAEGKTWEELTEYFYANDLREYDGAYEIHSREDAVNAVIDAVCKIDEVGVEHDSDWSDANEIAECFGIELYRVYNEQESNLGEENHAEYDEYYVDGKSVWEVFGEYEEPWCPEYIYNGFTMRDFY